MTGRFRLPVFNSETLSQIIWGMENQDAEYMLNIKDGTLCSPEMGEAEPEFLVELPSWSSSDGYQLMVSFTNSCKDRNLRERLSKELSSKSHGIFRRFRDVLSENPETLKAWYDFKDSRMRSHIISYYRERFKRNKDELESDDLYEGELLSEFEVKHLEGLDDYCEKLLEEASDNAVRRKILGAFTNKEAYEILENDVPKGAIIFEVSDGVACVLIYKIEEEYREQGLFNLLFDLFNRDMERRHVDRVAMVFKTQSNFIKGVFALHETTLTEGESYGIYCVHEWNKGTDSSETAYVL